MTKYHGRNDSVTMPKKVGERNNLENCCSFLASPSGVTMFFLCITAEATNGPHADDSRRLFAKSAVREQMLTTVLLTCPDKVQEE